MVRRNLLKNISTSGGLLTADFIQSFQESDYKHDKITPQSFCLPKKPKITQEELNRKITEAWEKLKAIWDENSLKLEDMNCEEARKVLINPLMRELGFSLVTVSQDIEFEDESIKIYLSHRGWWEDDAPKIHTVSPRQDVDEHSPEDRNDRNPHDAMQLYLNLDNEQKWGIVTNGVLFRILREFHHTFTRGYIEFDLVNIFFERNFTDFLTLFRLSHASRYLEKDGIIPLEQFYEESVAAGVKIGEDLRDNVKNAIELLGNGLLTNELRNTLADDPELTKKYYRELLKIIYRVLFLMFAEQRGMLPMHESLYAEEYSLARLREKAQKRILLDTHCDLWYGLLKTFALIKEGNNDLKVFGYNGDLFHDEQLELIPRLKCRNDILIKTIRYLTLYEKRRILQRINFLDIGVEEIGSIYESLLDFVPRVLRAAEVIEESDYQAGKFLLDPRGASRKTTGSYYTDKRLIDELINSALKPVAENAITNAGTTEEEKEKAILELKVCDPACGSGAFLIAANNFLGKLLAQIRTGEEFPSEKEERIARRDILQHCIYGVDLNPMAIELARVSLWINAVVKNLPLNFLDHHLKCGNSLLGSFPRFIRNGIPNNAFKSIEGENKKLVRELKEINNSQRKSKSIILDKFLSKTEEVIDIKSFKDLSRDSEKTIDDINLKRKKYYELTTDKNYRHQNLIYDSWISIFFWPFVEQYKEAPTHGLFKLIMDGSMNSIKPSVIDKIHELKIEFSFFHWGLEFPEVFTSSKKGFDCILGNPPWETINIKKKEFFSLIHPEIAKTSTQAKRNKLIKKLEVENDVSWFMFKSAKFKIDKKIHFLKNSLGFSKTSKGTLNLFSVFTELSFSLLNKRGFMGLIIPSNIITDSSYKDFFWDQMKNNNIISFFDFINRKGFFPDTHKSYKFCLFTGCKNNIKEVPAKFAFYLEDPCDIQDEKIIEISPSDIQLINPNTLTSPIFSTKRDFDLTKKIYMKNRILYNEKEPFLKSLEIHRMFHISWDSDLFHTISELNSYTRQSTSSIREKGAKKLLPVYESKFIWHYDHRFASFEGCSEEKIRKGYPNKLPTQKVSTDYHIFPRYWIEEEKFLEKKRNWNLDKNWSLVVRDVTNATNQRTCIATIIPDYPTVNTVNHIIGISALEAIYLVCVMSSFVFDYIARQKVGGIHLTQYILKQIPMIDLNKLSKAKDLIIPKALELIYTNKELHDFGLELGFSKGPFIWDEERRRNLKAELDAIIAIAFDISEEELKYILDTFTAFRNIETKEFKHYSMKNLILHYYDKLKDKTIF